MTSEALQTEQATGKPYQGSLLIDLQQHGKQIELRWLPVDALVPHPKNPRVGLSAQIIRAIENNAVNGLFPYHSVRVDACQDGFHITSGHHRVTAARRMHVGRVLCLCGGGQFAPEKEIADALLFSRDSEVDKSFSAYERKTASTISVVFDGDLFTGEFIKDGRVQWLSSWHPASALWSALALWGVPSGHESQWEISAGAVFYKSNNGFAGKKDAEQETAPHTDSCERAVTGSVYFIQARTLGLIKIGYSSDVKKRIETLQTGCPDEIDLLRTIPGSVELERAIHGRFAASRVRGEWFTPSAELMQFIEGDA